MTSSDWLLPSIVFGTIALVLFFRGRPKNEPGDPLTSPPPPQSGDDLIERLQRTLGIGVMVQSVEPGDPVTVRATLMFGSRTTDVVVTGDSEADAWEELAKAAIAWRNADYQHVPMWPGGG